MRVLYQLKLLVTLSKVIMTLNVIKEWSIICEELLGQRFEKSSCEKTFFIFMLGSTFLDTVVDYLDEIDSLQNVPGVIARARLRILSTKIDLYFVVMGFITCKVLMCITGFNFNVGVTKLVTDPFGNYHSSKKLTRYHQ
jgi:hypothetical protein